MLIGERTGEEIKIAIGTVAPADPPITTLVTGRDLLTGLPKTVELTDAEVCDAISEPVRTIVETVLVALERTPPELAADLVDYGVVMAGGGSLLRGLDALLREETGLPIIVAEDPLFSVVRGVSRLLDDMALLEKISRM